LELEDFRSRDNWWKQSTIATQFVRQFPLENMKNYDDLMDNKDAFCLANPGEVYLVYIPAGSKGTKISLPGEKSFSVKWFNPREGGELQNGNISSVTGKGFQNLGIPPVDVEKDWVAIIQ
jgi:hypothetical protein